MSLLDEFQFPELSKESQAFLGQEFDVRRVDGAKGVHDFQLSGHEKKGLGYRFYIHAVESKAKTEEFDMEINDDIEMIQWFVNRDRKPVERVKELPVELLKFARKKVSEQNGIAKFEYVLSYVDPIDGKVKEDLESVVKKIPGAKGKLICKGGLYAEDYLRFQNGLGVAGLPLARWEKASIAQVKTLESEGIATVQQLAAIPSERAERWPRELRELFNQAIHYVNAEAKRADVLPFANEVLAVKAENSKLKDQLEAMELKISDLASGKKKSPGRPKKIVSEEAVA